MLGSTASLPPRFEELWRHCSALSDEAYWETDGLGDRDLEADLRAAAMVLHGGKLSKFRKSGRERPHMRWVRVEKGVVAPSKRVQTVLHWDKKSGVVVRADGEVYESCFQGDGAPDQPGSFQVILDKRMLFFVAESPAERDVWVSGINAIASKGIDALQRDDERLGAEAHSSGAAADTLVLRDAKSGCVYLREFGKGSALVEHWIMSSRSAMGQRRCTRRQCARGGWRRDGRAAACRRRSRRGARGRRRLGERWRPVGGRGRAAAAGARDVVLAAAGAIMGGAAGARGARARRLAPRGASFAGRRRCASATSTPRGWSRRPRRRRRRSASCGPPTASAAASAAA